MKKTNKAPWRAAAMLLAAASLWAGVSAPAVAAAAPGGRCDQACLKGFLDAYLDALAHKDPARVPVAAGYRFTEDGAQLKLGEGLWVTFDALGKYRHDFYDPTSGGAAAFVSLTENGFPDLLSIRLKVKDRKIVEIETVVSRRARGAANMPPQDPSWMETFDREEPAATRLTREQLIAGTIGYMRAIAFHDGSLAPFATSCIRLENGNVMALGPDDKPPVPMSKTTPASPDSHDWFAAVAKVMAMGLGCSKQLDTKVYSFITGYEDARLPIVDVKRQIVYGSFDFMRRGNVKTVTFEGKTYDMMPSTIYPNEMLNAEAWKFVDGKISRVEAVFTGPQAYKRGTGWPGGTAPVSRPIGD